MTVESRVRALIANEADCAEESLRPETCLQDVIVDSLGIMELTLALEEEFDIAIEDEDVSRLLTVQDAIHYVEARYSPKA